MLCDEYLVNSPHNLVGNAGEIKLNLTPGADTASKIQSGNENPILGLKAHRSGPLHCARQATKERSSV